MATKTVTIVGVALWLVGLLGLVEPNIGGLHLGPVHSAIHLLSGAIAMYLGFEGSARAVFRFCLILGCAYGLLGLSGFLAGTPEGHMLVIVSGVLQLGTRDHVLHVLLGTAFLITAIRARVAPGFCPLD